MTFHTSNLTIDLLAPVLSSHRFNFFKRDDDMTFSWLVVKYG